MLRNDKRQYIFEAKMFHHKQLVLDQKIKAQKLQITYFDKIDILVKTYLHAKSCTRLTLTGFSPLFSISFFGCGMSWGVDVGSHLVFKNKTPPTTNPIFKHFITRITV
jgi:hypothetical protein